MSNCNYQQYPQRRFHWHRKSNASRRHHGRCPGAYREPSGRRWDGALHGPAGDILVIERLDDDRHACWGAVMTAAARAAGIVGVVIDDYVTDVSALFIAAALR